MEILAASSVAKWRSTDNSLPRKFPALVVKSKSVNIFPLRCYYCGVSTTNDIVIRRRSILVTPTKSNKWNLIKMSLKPRIYKLFYTRKFDIPSLKGVLGKTRWNQGIIFIFEFSKL